MLQILTNVLAYKGSVVFVTSGALSIKLHSDEHIFVTKRLRDRKIYNSGGGGILYLYEHSFTSLQSVWK
jgi:hypothetical protein